MIQDLTPIRLKRNSSKESGFSAGGLCNHKKLKAWTDPRSRVRVALVSNLHVNEHIRKFVFLSMTARLCGRLKDSHADSENVSCSVVFFCRTLTSVNIQCMLGERVRVFVAVHIVVAGVVSCCSCWSST